jgi:hypothetical protein
MQKNLHLISYLNSKILSYKKLIELVDIFIEKNKQNQDVYSYHLSKTDYKKYFILPEFIKQMTKQKAITYSYTSKETTAYKVNRDIINFCKEKYEKLYEFNSEVLQYIHEYGNIVDSKLKDPNDILKYSLATVREGQKLLKQFNNVAEKKYQVTRNGAVELEGNNA